MSQTHAKTLRLAQLAMLIAIEAIMTFADWIYYDPAGVHYAASHPCYRRSYFNGAALWRNPWRIIWSVQFDQSFIRCYYPD